MFGHCVLEPASGYAGVADLVYSWCGRAYGGVDGCQFVAGAPFSCLVGLWAAVALYSAVFALYVGYDVS